MFVFKVRFFLKSFLRFLTLNLYLRYYWLEWMLPFHAVNLLLSVASWFYFGMAAGGGGEYFNAYGGNFLSFLILGLMFNSFLSYTMDSYRRATLFLIRGRVGSMGQRLSMYEFCKLSGVPIAAPILSYVVDGYIEASLSFLIYLLVGVALGLQLGNGNYIAALLSLLLGIAAATGIGLLSASMITIIGAWKGVEPIRWLVGVLTNVFGGVYFPVEVLPPKLRTVSIILPHTYSLKIGRLALLGGAGFSQLAKDFTVLSAMALILVIIGLPVYLYSLNLLKTKPLVE